MIYKQFQDKKLSSLGMGCMRFPTLGGDYNAIDKDAVKEMVAYALDQGVNYFDTAFGYHGGQSEIVLGEALKAHDRSSFYLADKFPGYDLQNFTKAEEIFEKQLQKCQVEYFDFYLLHCLTDSNIEAYLNKEYGVVAYFLEQKRKGRIGHLGFSTHASLNNLQRFLQAYASDLEFGQIQLNWLDWDLQNAKAQAELLQSYHLPIWVMEPVRGGVLAQVSKENEEKLKAMRANASVVEWAFRFVQSVDGVTVTLSGMSNMQQLQDNIATFQTDEPLNDREKQALLDMATQLKEQTVPCTGCRYCTSYCPMELNIPSLIRLYNEDTYSGGAVAAKSIEKLADNKKPSACVACRACEKVCPQNIKISNMMSSFAERLQK